MVKVDGDAFRRYFLSGALVALLYSAAEAILAEDIMKNNSVK